uniref:Malectin domain-containing protein n=1 Tax=Ciona savignyi TaxID=51511 RepID=H2ZEL9_CIOSA
ITLLAILCTVPTVITAEGGQVVYAVNAGGENHVDSNGISYLADPIQVGTNSDYGRRQSISRAQPEDGLLYQTERWHDSSFSYNIPVKDDGDYVLVLKFAEVYFYGPNLKVFNIQLNDHSIVQDLDIFNLVGHSTAHDEIIPLSIKKGKLSVMGEYSTFNGILKLEMVKGAADNPKICAFYLMKGSVSGKSYFEVNTEQTTHRLNILYKLASSKNYVPKLPEIKKKLSPDEDGVDDDEQVEEDDDDSTEDHTDQKKSSTQSQSSRKSKLKSGPPAADPYAEDSGSLVMPIMIAFGLFIPTVICLCRL